MMWFRRRETIPRFPVLNYHHVHDDEESYFRIRPSMFRAQMELLLNEHYLPLHPNHLIELKGHPPTAEKRVLVTFDDGYEDFYEHAWPVLRELAIPTVVFLISDYIGKLNTWDRNSPSRRFHLQLEQLRELKSEGVVFGSHTCTHRQLSRLRPDGLAGELRESKWRLESLLGTDVRTLAYPGGHASRAARRTTALYYELGFTASTAARDAGYDPYWIERFDPSFCRNLDDFRNELRKRSVQSNPR
jgi:peptidoglycan/xylan/chitin deacetylase (PgdA/CDA1 family)